MSPSSRSSRRACPFRPSGSTAEPGNLDFIKECHNEVRISIAHTCTDYDTAVKAFEAGATHMTHLYNAMPGITHRAPGPPLR